VIGREELSEAARYTDALAEENNYETVIQRLDADPAGLMYVAQQRALRVAMVIDGMDPRTMSRTEKTAIKLSDQAESLMTHLTALAMDGITIGMAAKQIESNA
jgi:hypothetical protein